MLHDIAGQLNDAMAGDTPLSQLIPKMLLPAIFK
jgi:hypothetical protein